MDANGAVTTHAPNGVAPYVGGTVIDISSEDGSIINAYNKVYKALVE